ncbi:unnamed protein product [Owenia fusiformis]|uniref:Echinoderm microtubule-associated protein-like 2 n=1 Tax=Owenia fusiformis TaxID=6347 RepID=A0A8S4PIM0_OWEFU|nr:unnamed protein product [Owenia fusiformis]
MLSHENEEVRERVSGLEKRVLQQEDEIICLKAALSDCLRRLQVIESGRSLPNNILPSKSPMMRSNPRKTSSRQSMNRSTESLSSTGRGTPTPNRVVPRMSTGSMKKWPSMPSQTDIQSNDVTPTRLNTSGSISMTSLTGRYTSTPTRPRSKETTFNSEERCLKMYLRGRPISLYAPSDLEDYNMSKVGEPPTEKLKLEWVYGYRGRDCRSNLHLLPTGEIVYFIAGVVVLYNVDEQMQRHYLGHTDDVKCLAVHPDKITIATGQVAGHDKKESKRKLRDQIDDFTEFPETWPHIRIWDSVSLTTSHVIGIGEFDRAVCCVAFSKADGGQLLCAVDEANEHVLSVWDWQKGERGQKITETKSSMDPVLAAEFHPYERNQIITCGKGHLSYWTLDGVALTKKMGVFDRNEKPKYVLCLGFSESGDLITGDSNGNIFIWGDHKVTRPIVGAHEGGIFSLLVMKDGTILSGGGKDRKIIKWDSSYNKIGSAELPEQYGPVRTLSQGKGSMVLVGTTRNAILQGSIDFEFQPIIQGHMDELWGLAVHPNQHQFLTCSYDKTVYLWDALTHTAVWNKELNDGAHSACFHPNGQLVAIGTQYGRWIVLDLTSRDIVTVHTDGNEQIECLEYSKDGGHLAVASRDNIIYVYQVSDDGKKYSRIGKCQGHSSFVTHIDWSSDSQYLQSNSGDYEILYWNAGTCRHITSPTTMANVEWATQYCTLGFSVCGIWPEGADGTDVNGCARSNKHHLLASADDFGKVKLFRYPACQTKSACHIYGGHSSHVTAVRFLYDDSRLLSVGGKDMAVMQWEVL